MLWMLNVSTVNIFPISVHTATTLTKEANLVVALVVGSRSPRPRVRCGSVTSVRVEASADSQFKTAANALLRTVEHQLIGVSAGGRPSRVAANIQLCKLPS